jgi:hypothetical protein
MPALTTSHPNRELFRTIERDITGGVFNHPALFFTTAVDVQQGSYYNTLVAV